jgi:hypothetical protein
MGAVAAAIISSDCDEQQATARAMYSTRAPLLGLIKLSREPA